MDSFAENIAGVHDLVSSETNKTRTEGFYGDVGELEDEYTLKMSDDELLSLSSKWETAYGPYEAKIKVRQERNKKYYMGLQNGGETPTSSNLIFESQETFIPQALAKNPEPVVWSDNTEEGKAASNDLKTMLQYHADTLVLSRVLGVAIRHWSAYFIGVMKHGWDSKAKDITLSIRNPKNFILDVDGYVNVKGEYKGAYLGERIKSSAQELVDLYPKHKDYIRLRVSDKMGTEVTRTEWRTDDYCFVRFGDVVLEKNKNEFFNYEKEEEGLDENNEPTKTVTPGKNHFLRPKMPYTFLSVFSMEEAPHDTTNLIEQNIANQDRIVDRDVQIDKNLKAGNNSLVFSPTHWDNIEKAQQAAEAVEDGHSIFGEPEGVTRLPASPLPNGVIESQQVAKDTLRGVFGVQGLASQPQTADTTARGMILNQSHDSSRIGGGIGDALEQVADNIFNWWTQLYYVFYDEKHYAAIMGSGRAVEYVQLNMADSKRQFVVSVSPNSMAPRDEISEQNQAIELANSGWLDPLNLFKKLNYPDPMETAKAVTLFRVSPQLYMQTYFPESGQPASPEGNPNPPNMPPIPPGQTGQTLAEPPANPALSQVPLPK